jgi:Chaperone of endosialidase
MSDARMNTAGGTNALVNNLNLPNGGEDNTAFGFEALKNNTGPNILFGSNTAIGSRALRGAENPNGTANMTGIQNTAIGVGALAVNEDGSFNTAVGLGTLSDNTSGFQNVAVGYTALTNNRTGDQNTAVGNFALFNNTIGNRNTAVGTNALSGLGSDGGENNIAIGAEAGISLTTGSSNIYIGNNGFSESNTMRIGTFQTRTFIAGIAGRNVTGNPVLISNTGRLGIQVSSARYKEDIQTMGARSQGLLQLRPVTFRYKQEEHGERQYGLIADEVAEVYPELVTRGDDGEVESVRYHQLIPMLLNELQHQQGQLGAQAEQLNVLKTENEQLRAMLVQQQERDAGLAARLERLEAAAASDATLASR